MLGEVVGVATAARARVVAARDRIAVRLRGD
jgi:hypothetical protein